MKIIGKLIIAMVVPGGLPIFFMELTVRKSSYYKMHCALKEC